MGKTRKNGWKYVEYNLIELKNSNYAYLITLGFKI